MESGKEIKKHIKIDYVDFWPGLDKETFVFTNVLRKYYDVEISESPDYVFCSCFGGSSDHFKYPGAVKILYLGENIVPDFNLYDYAIGFNYIEFEDRYIRLPLYALYTDSIKPALDKHTFSDEYYLAKKGFCNYVISNPSAAPERDAMIDALNKYKTVDSGGKYRNNVGGPVPNKKAFAEKYRFTMAFENSSTPGYTTEKILEAFSAQTIPIYWGSTRVAEEFNQESFINCNDYSSFEEVVERVKEINENDELFLKMIKTPAIVEGRMAYEYIKDSYLDDFFRNIVEQEHDRAIRRNMVYFGLRYQNDMKKNKDAEGVRNIVAKPVHLIKKKLKQMKS